LRLYDASATDEFVDCCTSDIKSAIELVMHSEFSKVQPMSPNNYGAYLNPTLPKPAAVANNGFFNTLYANMTSLAGYNQTYPNINGTTSLNDGKVKNFIVTRSRYKRQDGKKKRKRKGSR
jgi:hypothetical protein